MSFVRWIDMRHATKRTTKKVKLYDQTTTNKQKKFDSFFRYRCADIYVIAE